MDPLTIYRQSHLRGFTICPRRTMHDLKAGDDSVRGWVGRAGDLGTAFHVFASVYLDTLKETGHGQMPTQEAIECMYEVLPQLGFTLPFEQMDELRYLVLGFCDLLWNPKKILAVEEELRSDIVCADGEVRTLKGQPDALLNDPPHGLIVVDFKTGRGRPKGPRAEPEVGEVVEERKYLSDLFQGDTYSLLALKRYPSAQYVIFRELHLRSGQIRQGRLSREALEHVERKLGVVMTQMDRAVREGEESPLWAPRPGSHCTRQCPVARSCPIPKEERGDGGIETVEDAAEAARRWAVMEGEREALRSQIKEWVEDPANPLPMANEDQVVGWKPPTGKGRRFGVWSKVDMVESEEAA